MEQTVREAAEKQFNAAPAVRVVPGEESEVGGYEISLRGNPEAYLFSTESVDPEDMQ